MNPSLVVNIDTAGLAKLIGKRKWARAFKEMCEVAEQQAARDHWGRLQSELPRAVQELQERKERDYTKPDGTREAWVSAELLEPLFAYKQERFDFYLRSMMQLVEAEINSSAERRQQ